MRIPIATLLLLMLACKPETSTGSREMANGTVNNNMDNKDEDANPVKDPFANPSNPNPALAGFIPVGYSDELEPMVKRLCTPSCHTGEPAPGSVVLNTAESLKPVLIRAVAAIDAGTMPPNAESLPEADKKILAQLAISLKNWSRREAYATTLANYKIAFSPAVNAINAAICLSCHKGDQPAAGLLLETHEQWKAAMPRILQSVEAGKMPPLLDEVQRPRLLRYLKTWQDQGMP